MIALIEIRGPKFPKKRNQVSRSVVKVLRSTDKDVRSKESVEIKIGTTSSVYNEENKNAHCKTDHFKACKK